MPSSPLDSAGSTSAANPNETTVGFDPTLLPKAWQLPLAEWKRLKTALQTALVRIGGMSPHDIAHKSQVMQALQRGENIPATVLRDYPDLTPLPCEQCGVILRTNESCYCEECKNLLVADTDLPDPLASGMCCDCRRNSAVTTDKRFCMKCMRRRIREATPDEKIVSEQRGRPARSSQLLGGVPSSIPTDEDE